MDVRGWVSAVFACAAAAIALVAITLTTNVDPVAAATGPATGSDTATDRTHHGEAKLGLHLPERLPVGTDVRFSMQLVGGDADELRLGDTRVRIELHLELVPEARGWIHLEPARGLVPLAELHLWRPALSVSEQAPCGVMPGQLTAHLRTVEEQPRTFEVERLLPPVSCERDVPPAPASIHDTSGCDAIDPDRPIAAVSIEPRACAPQPRRSPSPSGSDDEDDEEATDEEDADDADEEETDEDADEDSSNERVRDDDGSDDASDENQDRDRDREEDRDARDQDRSSGSDDGDRDGGSDDGDDGDDGDSGSSGAGDDGDEDDAASRSSSTDDGEDEDDAGGEDEDTEE